MTIVRARHEDLPGPAPEVEAEIGELARRGIAQVRSESGSEVGNLNSLIQRVSGTSVLDIERLIDELQTLRDYLWNEGQRIQRETKSTKLIAESLVQWKQSERARVARG
jgi:hypothetical protein